MNLCIKVKIKVGKRTPPQVSTELSGPSDRIMEFPNGLTLKESQVAEWLFDKLQSQLDIVSDEKGIH